MEKQFQIIPIPQKLQYRRQDCFKLKKTLTYSGKVNKELFEKWTSIWLRHYFSIRKCNEKADIELIYEKDFKEEQYEVKIDKAVIEIKYGEDKGLYYAILTLAKICNQCKDMLPELLVEDWPDIHERGLLLDISRGRMPKIETLYQTVDNIALLNYNQLQLYIEGPVFNYETITWEGKKHEDLLTFEEVKLLQKYCNDRCITLAPNQNVLGHMKGWLQLPEFRGLSEKAEDSDCATLDVSNPISLTFSKQLICEIDACYQSKMINVNLDEPDELGKGNSKELVEKSGKANVYLEYTYSIYKFLKSLNKKMMMWADVVDTYPDLLKTLPKDIVLLSWGYEAHHDFKKQAAQLKHWGGEFYLCPGTSSWLSFSGRIQGMLENVKNAIITAKEYGGNVLLTDWGDGGHIQHPFVSYPAYTFAGNGMWHVATIDKIDIEEYISKSLGDDSNTIGQIIVRLGNYYQYEGFNVPNQTMTYGMIQMGYEYEKIYKHEDALIIGKLINTALINNNMESFKYLRNYDATAIVTLLDALESQARDLNLCKNQQIKKEILNTILWIRLAVAIKIFIDQEYKMKREERQEKIACILQRITQMKREYKELWLYRNKEKGLENVMQILNQLGDIYEEKNRQLSKGIGYDKIQKAKAELQYMKRIIKDRNSTNNQYKKLYKKYLTQGGRENECGNIRCNC